MKRLSYERATTRSVANGIDMTRELVNLFAMRLFLLITLTMVAFAANSVLNRMALIDAGAGPAGFAALRVVSGALALAVIYRLRPASGSVAQWPVLRSSGRWLSTGALFLYLIGFSFAYVSLDAGVGALILFGGVQITMFAGAVLAGERPGPWRWAGSILALGGLAWLLLPDGATAPDPIGAVMMGAAAIGWGVYSLLGRGVKDPLGETAANFICAAPIGVLVWGLVGDQIGLAGAMLAVISGVVTSGLGYALWYSVLPKLEASIAALAQLTVPIIALAGGIVFLGEALTLRFAVASVLVLGGIALGVFGGRIQRSNGSNGS